MKKSEIIKNRVINKNDFYWKIFHPSLSVKNSFLKLFLLIYKDFSKFFVLKSIMWDRNKFNITLETIWTWEEYILFLSEANNKEFNGWLCTENICINSSWLESNKEIKKFITYFSINWKLLKFDNLLHFLTQDYKAKRDYYKIFWKSEVPPYSLINHWGADIHKVRFILNENIVRDLDHSLEFNIPEIFLHHSERECLWINPINDNPNKLFRFFNYSDEFFDHEFDKYFYLDEYKKKELDLTNELQRYTDFTDLNEEDIIMWDSNTKLQKMVDAAEKLVKEKNLKLVGFNCSCVPRIIWDDIYSILDKAKERLKVPFIFEWTLDKTPFEYRVEMLDDYINEIDKSKLSIIKNSIALFWYHQDKHLEYLVNILKLNWVSVNLIFIPMVDIKLLPWLFESELFVFSDNKHYEEIFEYPFKYLCNNKYIAPKTPAWIIWTDNWFKNILSSFNIEYKRSDHIEDIINEYDSKVELVEKNKYKVWIIFTWLDDIKRFFRSEYTSNIDIIWFLEDMWFSIEFIVFDIFTWENDKDKFSNDNWNHDLIINEINNKIKFKDKHKIDIISSEDYMYELIDREEISLVYSDVYFDERVVKMWLNQFNLRSFKLGYEWSLETINNLIKLCNTKYFSNFKKYLKK